MSLFWDQLLQLIKEGLVIPIVGRDLLSVRYQGREENLYRILARRWQNIWERPLTRCPRAQK